MFPSSPKSPFSSTLQSEDEPLGQSSSSVLPTTNYISRPPSRLVRSRHSYINVNATSDLSETANGNLAVTYPTENHSRSRPTSPNTFLSPLPQDPDGRNLLPLSLSASSSRPTTPVDMQVNTSTSTNASEAESEGGSGSDWRRRRKRTGSLVGPGNSSGSGELRGHARDLIARSLVAVGGGGQNGMTSGTGTGSGVARSAGWFWGMAPAPSRHGDEYVSPPNTALGITLSEKDGRQNSFTTGSTSGTASSSPSFPRQGAGSYGVFSDSLSPYDRNGGGDDFDDPMASSTTQLFAPSTSRGPSGSSRRNSNQSQISSASVAISSEMARHSRGIRQLGTWFKRKIGLGAAGVALAAAAATGNASVRSSGSGAITLNSGDGIHGDYRSLRRPRTRRKTRDSTGRIVPILRNKKERKWWHHVVELVPTSPLAFTLSLLVIVSVALGLTFTIKHILNPDKAPLPWRSYCTSQHPTYWALQFPPGHKAIYQTHTDEYDHDQVFATLPASAENLLVRINHTSPVWPFPASEQPPFSASSAALDAIEPVGVFVGIFSTDQARERRMMIRQTYGSHRKSRVPGTEAVRLRFIMGQPRPRYESAVRLEMQTFGDIVLLDIVENMNAGKTHAFFSWAAENATVPDLEWPAMQESISESTESDTITTDEDVPGEANSYTPDKRSLTIDDVRMAVQFHGGKTVPIAAALTDQANALWKGGMTLWRDEHPEVVVPAQVQRPVGLSAPWYYESPVYKGERRPDYIVKADEDSFIMLGELERRLRAIPRKMTTWGYLVKDAFMAGEAYALSFDLVRYIANAPALQAMVHGKEDKLTAKWLRMHPERESILWVSEKCWIYDHPKAGTVYSHGYLYPEAVDEIRKENVSALEPAELKHRGGKVWAETYSTVSRWGSTYKPPYTDLTPAQAVEALVEGSEMSLASTKVSSRVPSVIPNLPSIGRGGRQSPTLGHNTSYEPDDVFSRRPTRQERFKHDPMERGGTVVVHYIKRQDWFMETAMALLGNFEKFHLARAAGGESGGQGGG